MSRIVLVIIVFVLCVAGGLALALLIQKARKRRFKRGALALLAIAISFCLMVALAGVYLSVYYHADERALQALENNDPSVAITYNEDTYVFDGPGIESALVFLPGAKVETASYAPLMRRIAQGGVDCYLVDPPLHMAPLALMKLDAIVDSIPAQTILMSGHSLGGVAAASYADSHQDSVDALVLLAAYPTHLVPDSMELLSVYGSEDLVLNAEDYEQAKRDFWPQDAVEVVVAGGNHAGFGDYGEQSGDERALISNEEQQEITASAVVGLVNERA